MIETTRGLVLRTRPLTETSLIIHWLTPGPGRLATVAKGARRPKSPFRGKLDLFYVADFSFVRSRTSDLHNLREISLIETHSFLRRDLASLQQVSYAAALLEQTTETETPVTAMYNLLLQLLTFLRDHPGQPKATFAFELKLLDELGLRPDLEKTRLPRGTRLLITSMIENNWDALTRLGLSEGQEREIRQFLHGVLIYHFGRLPPGHSKAFDPEPMPT
jgi:DNA repair protein RecO (recombination protein O)